MVQKNSKTKCSESDRAESLNIIIFFIIASFLTILFSYIIRFGYEGAPTLLEDILVIVLPPIIIILFYLSIVEQVIVNLMEKNLVYKSI